MHRFLLLIASAALCLAPQASSAKPEEPSQLLHAWLLPDCPITPTDEKTRSGIWSAVFGFGVDYVIDAFGKALSEAARKNREGEVTTAVVPSYLYLHHPSYAVVESDGKASVTHVVPAKSEPMRCLVIARASTPPQQWCGSGSPFEKKDEVCKVAALLGGKTAIAQGDSLISASFGTDVLPHWPQNTPDVPSFYAEIGLSPSNDGTGFLPQLKTLYYPKSFHSPAFKDKPRDLLLTASAATPKGDAALGTILIKLEKIVPKSGLQTGLEHDLLPWTGVIAVPEKLPLPTQPGGVLAVNLKVEVREIGKANALLQLVAKLLDEKKADIAATAKTYTPDGRDAKQKAEAAAAQAAADKYSGKVGEAHAADLELAKACGLPASSEAERKIKSAAVIASYKKAYDAQKAAADLADAAAIPPTMRSTFMPTLTVAPNGSESIETCEKIF